MKWMDDYDLFLLDFDGLLVDTEFLHYRAYQEMCKGRGADLGWTFDEYKQIAHYSAEGLEIEVYRSLPKLKEEEPNWSVLYNEKVECYKFLLENEPISLMPGVESFLKLLDEKGKTRTVVTHSMLHQVDKIREKNRILDLIPNWITREDYSNPKPSPDGYEAAMKRFGVSKEKSIGFEDTPRGLQSLLLSGAKPVLITQEPYPEIPDLKAKGALHFTTFSSLPDSLPS